MTREHHTETHRSLDPMRFSFRGVVVPLEDIVERLAEVGLTVVDRNDVPVRLSETVPAPLAEGVQRRVSELYFASGRVTGALRGTSSHLDAAVRRQAWDIADAYDAEFRTAVVAVELALRSPREFAEALAESDQKNARGTA